MPPEPDSPGRSASHLLTPIDSNGPYVANELWSWATGEIPLSGQPLPDTGEVSPDRQEATFLMRNRPHHFAPVLLSDTTPEQAAERAKLARALYEVIHRAHQQGVSTAAIHDAVNQVIYLVLSKAAQQDNAHIANRMTSGGAATDEEN